ncbi:hypothetical protein B0H15DRAFT_410140 [Mycena belliarum]|uniref:Uncharacterized protein n=1 Tax=Mycena belliarum TaxID=1033014 RepID=A0AAD6UJR2_9AGAR|nr:hypothetical protein B0H15DRAFT_410140 [Mycena belliae]
MSIIECLFIHRCNIFNQFEGISATLVVATIDLILLMRVWVLFGKSRRLLYFLVPTMTAEIAMMLFIAIMSNNHANRNVHIGPILPGCYSTTVPRYIAFYPVPSLVVTSIMSLMTLYNCAKRLAPRWRGFSMPIVELFLRDGIYWFIAVLAINPPQLIIWAAARPTLTEVLIIPGSVVYSIIGSRVLLNIMEIMSCDVDRHLSSN